jgi:hypothetical protein
MKNKILCFLFSCALFPNIVLAQSWNVGARGDGWSFNIGSGGGVSGNSYGLPGGSILDITENILYWLLTILGIVSIIGFVIAGLLYLTAAGDEDRISKAKKALTYSIIGVIVGLSGFVVLTAANYMLSGQFF